MDGFSTLPSHAAVLAFDPHSIGRSTAYRPGFQPKGTYRIRTDEFTAARERKRSGKLSGEDGRARTELESQRLERRLEKVSREMAVGRCLD